jgi:S-DNA-T family DNA segregation ATPase FtsK/SpoIIIE
MAGVVVLAAALYLLVSLLAYPGLGADGAVQGDNPMGLVGNAVARWGLAAVGLSVYPLGLMLIVLGGRLLLGKPLRQGAPALLAGVIEMVALAVLFHVALRESTVHGSHLAGGAVGELLGEVMCSLFSTAGTYFVAAVVALLTAMVTTNISVGAWARLTARVGRWTGRTAVRGLDRLGSRVITVAERWEKKDKTATTDDDETEGEPPRRTSIKRRPQPQKGSRPAPEPSAAAEGDRPAAKVAPKVGKTRRSDDGADELNIRPLPSQEGWTLPPLSLLDETEKKDTLVNEAELQATADRLDQALADYGVTGNVTDIHPGPVVTLYEYVPKSGTKLSKISGLRDELAMRLAVERVRIVAPIPGKNAVGFEVPNRDRVTVALRGVLGHVLKPAKKKLTLPLALGRDIGGAPFGVDLARMPHLIVAGTTGSGKSVCVNALLLSLLYRYPPRDLRLILIDPKEVELGGYDDIPHLLVPVVTDMHKASSALRWAVDEMERRYDLFARTGVRNLESFNRKVGTLKAKGAMLPRPAGNAETEPEAPEQIPYIVIVLDELADLMMVAAREVETAIARLAQKARAAGLHLVVATQRPSTDVMSGTIRNNFPARISFRVATGIDSRTVLDTQGAESLLGAGDMLVRPPGTSELVRVHGAYVSEEEVERVVKHLKEQGQPVYEEAVLTMATEDQDGTGLPSQEEDEKYAEKYDLALALVASKQRASVSFIQRHLRVGYNTAARLMERMEREGVVGPERGSRPREVLVNPTEPG